MSLSRPGVTTSTAPLLIAVGLGLLLFGLAAMLSSRKDVLDSSTYWTVVYPASLLLSAALGYVFPARPWRWALCLFEAQLLGACLRAGEPGNLWPISMVFFAIVALPAMLAATLASRFKKTD